MRADRLLTLVALLRRHSKLSAAELARRLEVDRRTVLRDVEALSLAGFPIYSERGRNGGFALLPEFRPDVGGLTSQEIRALFLAGGQPALDRLGLSGPLATALTKLSAELPDDRQQQLDRAQQRIIFDAAGWFGGPDPLPELDTVQRAVLADRRLRFGYRPMPPGKPGLRTVDPYGLLHAAGGWYLIAAHRGRPRTYRLSRLHDARLLQQPSRRPDDLDLRALWEELRGRYAGARPGTKITIQTTVAWLDLIRGQLTSQVVEPPTITETAGHVIIEATVLELRGAVGVLAGFGDLIEVLGPPELITGLLEVADQLRARYRT